jgi:transposase-like protein
MTLLSSQPSVTPAVLDDEPHAPLFVTCPMCHTPTALTQGAIDAGADWRCVRCGQHWNASRLSAVAAYAAWVVERACASLSHNVPIERLNRTT